MAQLNPEQLSVALLELERLYALQNLFTGYAYNNMLLVGKAPQAVTETFLSPNLLSVAVQFYQNQDLWTVIATANNLSTADPEVEGLITLLIPPKPLDTSGGILAYFNNGN